MQPVRRGQVEPWALPPYVLRLRPVATIRRAVRKLRTINPWPFIGWMVGSMTVLFAIAWCAGLS
jgi:hypothetical protein